MTVANTVDFLSMNKKMKNNVSVIQRQYDTNE